MLSSRHAFCWVLGHVLQCLPVLNPSYTLTYNNRGPAVPYLLRAVTHAAGRHPVQSAEQLMGSRGTRIIAGVHHQPCACRALESRHQLISSSSVLDMNSAHACMCCADSAAFAAGASFTIAWRACGLHLRIAAAPKWRKPGCHTRRIPRVSGAGRAQAHDPRLRGTDGAHLHRKFMLTHPCLCPAALFSFALHHASITHPVTPSSFALALRSRTRLLAVFLAMKLHAV